MVIFHSYVKLPEGKTGAVPIGVRWVVASISIDQVNDRSEKLVMSGENPKLCPNMVETQ